MRKIKIILLFIIMITICTGCFSKKKEYTMNLYYMDTYIYVKFYSDDKALAEQIKQDIEKIYLEYHQLSDRYKSYDSVINVYDIYHNKDQNKTLTIDSKLYNLIVFASEYQKKTQNLFSIEIGDLVDIWKEYREKGTGLPTKKELLGVDISNKLVLLGDNKIKNNNPNLDLGAVSKGYTTEEVGKYLKEQGITEFLINAGGNVLVGEKPNEDYYQIGVQGPNKDGSLVTIVKGKNISVVTSGSYERNYEYEGKIYSHIINPMTRYPADYMKSVTVITEDSALGDVLSTILFLMPAGKGQEFIKNYSAEAIWVLNDDTIIRSEGFDKYE